jgi:hypothetical protein
VIPILLGAAAGAAWLISPGLGAAGRFRKQFPSADLDVLSSRDKLFRLKSAALLRLGQLERLNDLSRAWAAAHPGELYSSLLLLDVARHQGRWTEVLELARRLEAHPGAHTVGLFWRGNACLRLGQRDEGRGALRRFVELEPTSELAPHLQTALVRIGAEEAREAAPRKRAVTKKPRRTAKARVRKSRRA